MEYIEDVRQERKVRHLLKDILVIVDKEWPIVTWYHTACDEDRIRRSLMKMNKERLCALFLFGLCCLMLLNGCGSKEKSNSEEKSLEENIQVDSDSVNIGEFSMEDIQGKAYTQEMFADYNLTMVNVFTTWCTPCINEIPDLEKLRNNMEDQGVNVVGIVLDAIGVSNNIDEEAVEKAELLAEQTGAAYPFLIPDATLLNGRLSGITAVPETFFVDQEGNIIGETYSGSHSLEEWESIVETTLKEVE